MIPILRVVCLLLGVALPAHAETVTVFAAVSLGDALGEAAKIWQDETGHTVTLVLAGSATLARQIDAAAPADIYVSANHTWMDWLEDRARVLPDTRVDLASNKLVLVASDPTLASDMVLTKDTAISDMLGQDGRLAMALPEAVPAGIYGKAALSSLGQWRDLSSRLAPTDNVRAALALVALGEAPLGVVYATDAQAESRVVVAGVFAPDSHPPVRYPAALVADSGQRDVSSALLDWLQSSQALDILLRHGFLAPGAVQK